MNRLFSRLALLLLFLSVAGSVFSQADTEFWFAAPDLQAAHGDNPILFRMAAAQQPATVTISIPANPSFIPVVVNVPANTSISVDLTARLSLIENSVINAPQQKGIFISSTARITCFYDIANLYNGDMYALKGSNGLGTKFTLPFQMAFMNRTDGLTRIPPVYYTTDFIIVATENNTKVTVNATCNLTGQASRNFTFTLNKGESYACSVTSQTANDKPGGTIVTSDKPIAITTKDDSLLYPTQGCSDTAGDQLIPDMMAGTQFVVIKSYFSQVTQNVTVSNPDYYYVYATENNTTIKVNGIQVASLATAGAYYTGVLNNVTEYIESDKPVQVFQISGFGCEIGGAVIPSIKCTGSSQVNVTRASSVQKFYVNVLAPASIINDFLLNGSNALIDASQFQVVPSTSNQWYVARIAIPTSVAGAGASVMIENNKGKFHVGIIHGDVTGTTRFGYFSDFSSNTVEFSNPQKPGYFLNKKDTACYKGDIRINVAVSDGITYTWSGPNNYTGSGNFLQVKNFLAADTGSYIVTATTQGCGVAKDSIRLAMDRPIADFTFSTNGCEKDSARFTPAPSSAVRWVWNFDNGKVVDTNSSTTLKAYLSQPRNYNVALKVGSRLGCFSDDSIKTIHLSSIPKPSYTIPPITCVNSDLKFTDNSTILVGTLVKWRWDVDTAGGFHEFNSNIAQQARYTIYGSKKVKLVVESETGCVSDTFSLNSFFVNSLPIVGFVNPEVCLNDASAQFIDSTKSPDGNTNFTYQWFFNDGQPAVTPGPDFLPASTTQKNPSVHYNKAAQYQVKLIVNSMGCIDSLSQNFKVNGANPVPLMDVVENLPLCSNDSIRIINRSTVDFGDVTRLEIFWDVNDLTRKTVDETPFIGKSYSYLYGGFQTPSTQPYTIRLKAYSGDALSCTKNVEKIANLLASPKVSFNPIPGICLEAAPRIITQASFDANVPGTGLFSGPGVTPAGLFDPSQTGAGTFTMKYLYVSNTGCRDSLNQPLIVWPRPLAAFDVSPILCEKNPVVFSSHSQPTVGKLVDWNWNFADGTGLQSIQNENPLPHVFTQYNTYQVSLQVVTDNGCTSPLAFQTLQINPLPRVGFDLPVVCLPEGKALFVNKTNIPDGTFSQLSYRWDFGDPSNLLPGLTPDGLHYYKKLGVYKVKLVVQSSSQCKDSLEQSLVDVFPQPKAGFSSLDSVCIGKEIIFVDTSNGLVKPLNGWSWNFADGNTSIANHPVHLYQNPGTYKVTHFVTTTVGCNSDTVSKTIIIHPYPKISAGPDLYALEDGLTLIPATATGTNLIPGWSPATYLNRTDLVQPTIIRPQADIVYTFTVTGSGACTSTDDVKVTVLRKPAIPNTFTPNGDGINDVWEIKNLEQYPDCRIEVYTPQGQVVFKSNGYGKPWDGTWNGHSLPIGTYYYVIDPRSGRSKMAGYVTIFK